MSPLFAVATVLALANGHNEDVRRTRSALSHGQIMKAQRYSRDILGEDGVELRAIVARRLSVRASMVRSSRRHYDRGRSGSMRFQSAIVRNRIYNSQLRGW